MSTYLYKPGHSLANKRGFVIKEDYYHYQFMTTEDKRMFKGNEAVEFRFISDTMEPTRHMACPVNHPLYTSKKKFRDETKARGCVEVGNDIAPLLKPRKSIELDRRQRREAIRQTIRDYKEGKVSEPEKFIAKKTAEMANYQARNRVRKS